MPVCRHSCMAIFPDAPVRAHVRGRVRHHALDGVSSLAVNVDGVLLVPLDDAMDAGAPVRVGYDDLDGVRWSDDTLTLHLRDGGSIRAEGDPRLREVAGAVLMYGRVVPELTRALRTLGGRRGGEGQDAFFRPLLEARRIAAAGGQVALDAFDAPAIRLAVESQLAGLAEVREPARPAARRALEACLCDAAEPLLGALGPVAGAAARARDAAPAEILRAWREWARAVVRVFERADAAWIAVRAVLETPSPRTPVRDSGGGTPRRITR